MNTLDQLPSGEPLKLLRELDQLSKELKAPQIFGSSSVATDRIFTGATYDVSVSSSGARDVLVEFIPDDLTFGGAFCYQLIAIQDVDLAFPSIAPIERQRVVDDRQQWVIYALIPGDRKYKLYFFVAGSGTFTTNLI